MLFLFVVCFVLFVYKAAWCSGRNVNSEARRCSFTSWFLYPLAVHPWADYRISLCSVLPLIQENDRMQADRLV